MNVSLAGLDAHGHFLVAVDDMCLACGFFARSKTKVRGISANFGKKYRLSFGYWKYSTENDNGWTGVFSAQHLNRDRFTYCLVVNKDIGKQYLLTTNIDEEIANEDFYNYLMEHYKLPLKKEWIPRLKKELLEERYCLSREPEIRKATYGTKIYMPLNGKELELENLIAYDFSNLKEELFERVVSSLLSSQQICITPAFIPSLQITGLDDYFKRYGSQAIKKLDEDLHPLVELRPNVKNLALKSKRLFPQQAASIEGALAMEKNGIRYTVLNHGMGCGKTLEAASIMDAMMVEKWLKKNPQKTLKDAYMEKGTIRYRAIIMAPGHLVSKWAQEIEEEIPYAKAIILNGLSQLVSIREAGKVPAGKEFYIISKDFCKLDTQLSPIPVHMKKKHFALDICTECKEETGQIYYKRGIGANAACPRCFGKTFEPYQMSWLGSFHGLVCPKCGELLIKYRRYDPDGDDFDAKVDNYVLTPASFATPKGDNSCCYHCGEALWGSNAKPLITNGVVPNEPKWYKVSHFKNHTHKTTQTAFVLKGHEQEYYDTCVTIEGLQISPRVYGPRKVAPSRYIKKYLKGYFDFCVLDECHKYLGQSAQSCAAHALITTSRFTLALTGTISNGTASCFYNLFWMLEPQRMKELGYKYSESDLMRFCKEYGCVETIYEASERSDHGKNLMSRGRQISEPRVKPGISPVLFGKLLLDRCLFMDISDLSKYLPALHEEVCLCEPDFRVLRSYNRVLDMLRDASQSTVGMAACSIMLQFGLSYLDKPYGRLPIMNPYVKDALLCNVENYEEYEDLDTLLPKEKKLIELVNQEVEQGRGCFVYATFTNKEETNVSYRLKALLEKHCNLRGMVEIIQSASPVASKREEWFHKRASEGIKVFITNPMNVETGLDFCFKHNGVVYNYPTLIFYQISYSLATIWQASRRAYRLNQKEMCRTIYLGYTNTLQAAALEIMARKQVATAAIQGKFSAEGLASMAKGVDMRTQLAEALSRNDMSSGETLENMFDALATMNEEQEEDEAYKGFRPSPSFWELIGKSEDAADEFANTIFAASVCESMDVEFPLPKTVEATTSFADEFLSFFNSVFTGVPTVSAPKEPEKANPSKKKVLQGQCSLFDL